MNRMLLVTALLCGTLFSGKAQNNVLTMDNQRTKTIRLVYPQWQGGDIAHWITEVKDPEQASRGYYLGAQLLNFLAPDSGQETYTVPVATDKIERKVTDGVLDKEALIAQTRAALDILKITHPDKIVREVNVRQASFRLPTLRTNTRMMWQWSGLTHIRTLPCPAIPMRAIMPWR